MSGVQILDYKHLKAGRATLARRDCGPCQKEFPDTIPALTVLGLNGVGVAKPVAVPAPEGARVVDADRVNAADGVSRASFVLRLRNSPLDLPSSTLKAAYVVGKRGGGVGARKNVLVQIKPPDKILVLPCPA